MPSTNPLPSLTLSFRRADMAGFWILGTTILSLSLGLASAALGAQAPWAWGAAGGACLLVPGLFWRQWFETGVWVWNGSMRRAAAALRTCTLVVCYYTLFAALGRSGSSLELLLRQPDASRWAPLKRGSPWIGNEGSPASDRVEWYQGLYTCARTTGNGWVVCLLPIVLLLILLRDEQQESALPSSTYTLY